MQETSSTGPGSQPAEVSAVAGKVYTPLQVAAATFLGSPFAGAILLSSNYALFGKSGGQWQGYLWGVVATAVLFLLATVVPANFPKPLLPTLFTIALYGVAKQLQGDAIDEFIQSGGEKHSNWRVVAVAVACLALVTVLLFAYFMVEPSQ